jgi:dienelactone hydrolase
VRALPLVLLALVASAGIFTRAEGDPLPLRSPLHGNLASGPYDVGLTRLTLRDGLRPTALRRVGDQPVSLAARARLVHVDVWYPASLGAAATPLTVADYLVAHVAGTPGPATRARPDAARTDALRRTLGTFGTLSDEAFAYVLAQPFLAVRDAVPAAGPFPLVVGQLRPMAMTITNEHLASHGYVVAMVSGDQPETPDAGRGLEVAVRDMELAIAELRTRPYVDPDALGALGFSGAGFSQLLLAMRHPDVDAVCDLESAIFDDRVNWPLQRGWGYDVAELRVPFLHTYSVPLSRLENRRADFEAMRYSTRYHYLVDAPGITHGDFATEGMIASLMPGLRGAHAARLQKAFETTNRYVRAFFDAHVKGEPAGAAFLSASPVANGVPNGLVTLRVLRAVEPAPTPAAFGAAVRTNGFETAMQQFREGLTRDPQAPLYQERSLNAVGYRLFRDGKVPEAIGILRTALELYPGSPNAYDSLSEVLESAGQHDEARTVVLRGLEAAAAPSVSPGDREAFTRMLRERLARLRP